MDGQGFWAGSLGGGAGRKLGEPHKVDSADAGSEKAKQSPTIFAPLWALITAATLFFTLYWFNHIGPHPDGIVGLELSWRADRARELLRVWGPDGGEAALSTIRWDWIYIVSYVVTLAGLCTWGAHSLANRGRLILRIVLPAIVVAGLLDVIENIFLLKLIDGPVTGRTTALATTFAAAKFFILIVTVVFGLATSFNRIALAIEEYLRSGSPKGATNPFRTQLLSHEVKHAHTPASEQVEGGWRRFLIWLIAIKGGAPVASAEGAPEPDPEEMLTGICCSGGGIRSAAYNLGALQALREKQVLDTADYVSAVSGGSYIASSHAMVTAKTEPALLNSQSAYHPESPEATYLLNHSAYLGPAGIAGKLWMIVRTLLGVAVNIGFLAGFLFLVGRPLGWWYRNLHPDLLDKPVQLSSAAWMWISCAIPVAVGVMLVLGDLFSRPIDRAHRLIRAWYIRFINVGLALFILFIGLPYLIQLIRLIHPRDLPLGNFTLPTAGVGGLLLGAIQNLFAKRRRLLAMLAGGIIGPLMLLSLLVIFSRQGLFAGYSQREVVLWLCIGLIFLVFYLLSDLTSWSPHPFYKRALWSSFGLRRVRGPGGPVAQEISYDQNVALRDLLTIDKVARGQVRFPKLLICAAANLSDEGATPPGRNAATFTFDADEIGGPMVGQIGTDQLAKVFKHQMHNASVGSAVAVSGAAISPSMGRMTYRSLRFLMGFLNIRLGVWLPNPLWADWWCELNARPGTLGALRRLVQSRPRPRFLLREMLGLNRLNSKFLYVSDGGHYENLGLVELLRRRCRIIYCFDASGDQEDTFYTMGQAVALARTELDIEIFIRPEAMKPPKDGEYAAADFCVGQFRYSNGVEGILIFAKAAVTRDAPLDVRAFKQKDKRFPNHSTADQFFNEQKFEAYRALGLHTARAACGFIQGLEDLEERRDSSDS